MTGSRARRRRRQAAQTRTGGCPSAPRRQRAIFDPSLASPVLPPRREQQYTGPAVLPDLHADSTVSPPGAAAGGELAAGDLGGSPADAPVDPDRAVDQLAQRIAVHVAETPEVQAALPALVPAQPRQHRPVPVTELVGQVDDQMLAAR